MQNIVKSFNNIIKKTIFKVQNKTNNNFKISNFNKCVITFIGLLFFYLFYLLIPLLYDKTWVQTNIESKLLNEFKITISTSANISYRILPAPHFLIKDSKILVDIDERQKSIAEIKDLKVFISQRNFFNKEQVDLKKIVISNANFSLLRSDFKSLNTLSNNDFSNKKIKINNSIIFFKDNTGEIISIVKLDRAILFYDDKKLFNLISLKGETYAIPFTFIFKNQNGTIKNKKIDIDARSLKLNIFNETFIEKNNLVNGKNVISFLNSTINTKYNIKKKLITFVSDNSIIKNSKINYSGELSTNPFNLNLNVDLGEHEISKLLNINSIFVELIKSGALFNDNITISSSIVATSNIKNAFFQYAKINFNITNGKIDLNNTEFSNDKIGLLTLNNSNLFNENNNLVLNTDVLIDIKNLKPLFSFLNTNKLSRKKIKKVLINLDYNISTNKIKFINIKIDKNIASDQLLLIINDFGDNNFNNLNKSRRLLNALFNAYEG